jgi:hypothetical protein
MGGAKAVIRPVTGTSGLIRSDADRIIVFSSDSANQSDQRAGGRSAGPLRGVISLSCWAIAAGSQHRRGVACASRLSANGAMTRPARATSASPGVNTRLAGADPG